MASTHPRSVSRRTSGFARWLLPATVGITLALPPGLHGQTVSYQAGYSNSWGKRNITVCAETCGPGWVRSHKDLAAPLLGISLAYGKHAPYWLESGFMVTRKGWQVTTPTLDSWAVEVPALAHVGFRPRGRGVGASVAAGAAFDVPLMQPLQSRPAAMAAAQVFANPGGRSLWSAGVRYTRGLFTNYDKYVYAVSFFVSVSPRGFAQTTVD